MGTHNRMHILRIIRRRDALLEIAIPSSQYPCLTPVQQITLMNLEHRKNERSKSSCSRRTSYVTFAIKSLAHLGAVETEQICRSKLRSCSEESVVKFTSISPLGSAQSSSALAPLERPSDTTRSFVLTIYQFLKSRSHIDEWGSWQTDLRALIGGAFLASDGFRRISQCTCSIFGQMMIVSSHFFFLRIQGFRSIQSRRMFLSYAYDNILQRVYS
ncbi:hypothetical protein DFS34DRAFT_94088 [Phlyctochytrium arcticum]|nr:hypothetical protein DFS34DRAFT_94088 [Phlyctochytrium arcticum]